MVSAAAFVAYAVAGEAVAGIAAVVGIVTFHDDTETC